MKHLTDEERLAFIEGHASFEAAAHLQSCAECAAQIGAMRESITRLQNFSFPAPLRPRRAVGSPWFRWAAAAAVILSAGFLTGRATGPSPAQIKAQVAQELRETLREEI
jgi:hypothetical protein